MEKKILVPEYDRGYFFNPQLLASIEYHSTVFAVLQRLLDRAEK